LARASVGNLRTLWLNIHLWIGVGLAVVLIPLGVSGALLVWDQSFERMLNTDRYAVAESRAMLPPSAYVAAAEQAFAGRAVTATLRLPAEAGVPVTVVGQIEGAPGPGGRPRQLTAWLDPATARVTDVEEVARSGFSVLHRLHGSFLIPGVGRKIVGWLGWAMTVSSVTGLVLWWPRNGAFIKGLRWLRAPSTFDNLHHLIGFWVCVPLAVLSLTGVYISFPQTSRAVFGQPTASAPQRPRTAPVPIPPAQARLSVDEAVSLARATGGEAAVSTVTFPTTGREPRWRVDLQAAGGSPRTVQVADTSGAASLDKARPAGRAGQDTVSRLMRQVHDGAGMGPIWQTLIFLGGMAPAVLGVTGVVMWLRSRGRKTRLRTAQAPA
jgi:uncharacterized iron-regulated membrane protein